MKRRFYDGLKDDVKDELIKEERDALTLDAYMARAIAIADNTTENQNDGNDENNANPVTDSAVELRVCGQTPFRLVFGGDDAVRQIGERRELLGWRRKTPAAARCCVPRGWVLRLLSI